MIEQALIGFAAATLAGLCLAHAVKRYAEKRGVLDHPNERSLHGAPVARGGGLAIAIVTLSAQALLVYSGTLTPAVGVTWIGCGFGFALIGWIDDHADTPVWLRFLAQTALAAAFTAGVIGWHTGLPLAGAGWGAVVPAVLWVVALVWAVNLFNFMDGADGFAATGGLLINLFGAAAAYSSGDAAVMAVALAVAGGCAGFLGLNWSPARLFMGDVGSYFVGFQLAALALYGSRGGVSPLLWLVLCAPFVTDATLTLLRRFCAGEVWYRAHRDHAYQLLVRRGWSHRKLSLALAGWSVFVLWPLAWIGHAVAIVAVPVTLLVYLLAVMIWLHIFLRSRQLVGK